MSSSSLAGATLITIAVPAPSAGKNWAAELVGMLVAMLIVSVNVSLGPAPPFLINEELAVFWSIHVGADGTQKLEHLAGDLRPVLLQKLKRSALAD